MGDAQPSGAGAPGSIRGLEQPGGQLTGPAVLGAIGERPEQDRAVMTGEGAGRSDPAPRADGHGPAPPSRSQISLALLAACSHASLSPGSETEPAARARQETRSRLSPAASSATCSALYSPSGPCPVSPAPWRRRGGSDGANATASRPSAADAAAMTNAANRPEAGSS